MARILIVDDSTVMRKNLYTIFTEKGHEVVGEAIDGKQAIVLYSELKPDLVTMDITMPKMSGVEAVNFIVNKDHNAKIIMISALNQKQMVFEALKNGAKHYIIKPIDPIKLLGIVNEVLDESKKSVIEKRDENKELNSGFSIENLNGRFIVTFNEFVNLKDQVTLDTAIKGLLFIKPLNVVFDFEKVDKVSELILNPLIRIGNTITKSGGQLEYKTKSEGIMKLLQGVK
ncbi:MAG: response regulator [Clostridiaceae bacterium]|nr:response regulator [Clostridiaceae bacterium]